MRQQSSFFVVLCLLCAVAGCGSKGPLYLPKPQAPGQPTAQPTGQPTGQPTEQPVAPAETEPGAAAGVPADNSTQRP